MPVTCCMVGCSNRSNRVALSFFAIPSTKDQRGREDDAKTRRRQKWLSAINRSDLGESKLKNAKVCEKHFISGKPAELEFENHPDWAPSKHLGYETTVGSQSVSKKRRYIRCDKRNRKVRRGCADEDQASLIVPTSPEKTIDNSATSSSGHQSVKTHAREGPISSADSRTPSLNANIKAKRKQSICRTCLRTSDVEETQFYHINSTTSSESNWSSTIKQQFAACVPEVDFEITADAHICGYCAAALQGAYEFRKNCLKTEEMICNYVREVDGDIYNVNLEKLLKWIDWTTMKKLKSVDIVSDIARSDKGTEEICINNDSDISLSTVADEIEIKEEPLLDEHEMLKIVKVEGEGGHCDIKLEEMEVVPEPVFVDVSKLNEDDEHATVNITKIHEVTIENPPTINVDNLHTCKICQTSFSLKCDLRLHVILHANNTPPYECDECEFISPDKIILRRHLNSHTKELEFKCKACETSVNGSSDHDMQTCMINRLCGASAAKKSKLEEAVESNYQYDNSIGLTPLICKEINKIDMKYMCNICRELFTEKVYLWQHLKQSHALQKCYLNC